MTNFRTCTAPRVSAKTSGWVRLVPHRSTHICHTNTSFLEDTEPRTPRSSPKTKG